ncbi:hypothetical protein Avbf_18377, partial [Armadillidium vulgare]
MDFDINPKLIHILSYYDGVEEPDVLSFQKYFCQIWFNVKANPVTVPVYDSMRITIQKYSDSRMQPFVLSCKVPIFESVMNEYPIAVSLVSHQCQIPESILKVKFFINVKFLNFLTFKPVNPDKDVTYQSSFHRSRK